MTLLYKIRIFFPWEKYCSKPSLRLLVLVRFFFYFRTIKQASILPNLLWYINILEKNVVFFCICTSYGSGYFNVSLTSNDANFNRCLYTSKAVSIPLRSSFFYPFKVQHFRSVWIGQVPCVCSDHNVKCQMLTPPSMNKQHLYKFNELEELNLMLFNELDVVHWCCSMNNNISTSRDVYIIFCASSRFQHINDS